MGKVSEALAKRLTRDAELLHLLELVHAEDAQRVAAVRADLRAYHKGEWASSAAWLCRCTPKERHQVRHSGVHTSLRKQVE